MRVTKEDSWSKKNKAENPFCGGRTKHRRNHHISYLQADLKYPSLIVEVDGCSNALVCNDATLLQFRDFNAVDGDASNHLKSIGGHVLHITAVASIRAIQTIFYELTVWCTLITGDWIVNNLDLKIISAAEENGGIRIMKDDQRLINGFWYKQKNASSSLNWST